METTTTNPTPIGDVLKNLPVNSLKTSKSRPISPEEERRLENFRYRCQNAFRDSGIPKRHLESLLTIDRTVGKWGEVYQHISDQIGKGFILALVGNRGTGKSQMAACVMDSVRNTKTTKYVKAMDFFRELRTCFDKDHVGENECKMMDRFTSYGLLVIDEAHERGNSEWEDRTLVNLLDRRYDRMVDTILISNQTKDVFLKSVGASIASRIQETGEIIICDWKSYR